VSESPLSRHHLTGIDDLSDDDIRRVLNAARTFAEVNDRARKKVPALRGLSCLFLFIEPSTRTRLSFELAAKRLSADTMALSPSASALEKGESFRDTCRTVRAMSPDLIVVRHKESGAPQRMLDVVGHASVVNAGDGTHEHPTQALLDAYALLDAFDRAPDEGLEGKRVAIIGDIAHSRVAGSNLRLLPRLGAELVVSGPRSMLPVGLESFGVKVTPDVDEAIDGADAVMMLRIQRERLSGPLIPSDREYARRFGLNRERASRLKDDAVVLHPGPINRGVEIAPEVADGIRSRILDQVAAGVAVRMAVLYLLALGRGGDA
jgi:aspartate carbamoyltransferase catalytic subunit